MPWPPDNAMMKVLFVVVVAVVVAGAARADDAFDRPYQGFWTCANGYVGLPGECMPPEFRGVEWWKGCIHSRTDCAHSDTAFIGWGGPDLRAQRGPGYCYAQQPYTCAPNGRWP
jgi:hypothetical protein